MISSNREIAIEILIFIKADCNCQKHMSWILTRKKKNN